MVTIHVPVHVQRRTKSLLHVHDCSVHSAICWHEITGIYAIVILLYHVVALKKAVFMSGMTQYLMGQPLFFNTCVQRLGIE